MQTCKCDAILETLTSKLPGFMLPATRITACLVCAQQFFHTLPVDLWVNTLRYTVIFGDTHFMSFRPLKPVCTCQSTALRPLVQSSRSTFVAYAVMARIQRSGTIPVAGPCPYPGALPPRHPATCQGPVLGGAGRSNAANPTGHPASH